MFRYAPGQPLYRQGERSQALFLFASGLGQLVRTLADGSNRAVSNVQPGEYIGESSLYNATPRDVSAIAVQESVVLVLVKASLDNVLAARPDIRGALSSVTTQVPPTPPIVQPPRRGEFGGFFPPTVLVDGRRLIYHKHRLILLRNMARPLFGFALLVLLLAVANFFRASLGDWISPLTLIVFSFVWMFFNSLAVLWEYLAYLGDVYIIDDEAVTDIRRSPLGWREFRAQASLRQVQNVSSAIKSLIGRAFNYGDVYIQTAGMVSGASRLDFMDVPAPNAVAQEIISRMRALESGRR